MIGAKTGVLALMLVGVAGGTPVATQDQVVPVAILNLQDDTGANAPVELGQKLAQNLQQKIASTYKDVLPRVVTGSDPTATRALTIEQLAALGKQHGARFILRGGLLAVVSEPSGTDVNLTVQLYAEIVSVDTGTVAATVRAEGTATQAGTVRPLSAVEPGSEQFPASGLGEACANAITQLATSVHRLVSGPEAAGPATTPSGQPVTEPTTAPSDTVIAAEADAELQQLIAQAESLVSSGAGASTDSIKAVKKAVDALKSALASKAAVMEQGRDASPADQEIATRASALQAAMAQVIAEASSASAGGFGDGGQPSGQKKGLLAGIDESAGQAFSLLQKIQAIRAALRGVDGSAGFGGAAASDPGGASNSYGATPEPMGEVGGIVVDDTGNPVAGAQVSDPSSGSSTITDSNGLYTLKGLLTGQMATLIVTKDQKTVKGQAEVWPGHAAPLDFQLKSAGAGAGVLPSTIILRTQSSRGGTRGTLTGVVEDAQGRPVSRALVTLKGLGVARTNSSGQYTFANVPVGAQQLVVNQNGMTTKSAPMQVVSGRPSVATMQLATSDSLPTALARPSLIVSGSGATLKGTVRDKDNHPIAGARVSIVQQQSAVAVVTGATGTFELRNLKPGPYRVLISKPGYEISVQQVVLGPKGEDLSKVRLKPESSPIVANAVKNAMARRVVVPPPVTNQARVPAPARPVAPMAGQVSGRVTDSNGRPVFGAIISLDGRAVVTTDPAGSYLVNGLLAGNYKAQVSIAGYSTTSRTITVRAGNQSREDFALEPDQRRAVIAAPSIERSRVVKPGGVVGQVVDARTGRPIAGATVSMPGQRGIATDSAGRFALTNVPPGTYQLSVGKSGYASDQHAITVRAGETVQLAVKLTGR